MYILHIIYIYIYQARSQRGGGGEDSPPAQPK